MFKAIFHKKSYVTGVALGVAAIALPSQASATFLLGAADGSAQADVAAIQQGGAATGAASYVRDVPLALALRQILPEGYGYALAEGVDLEVLVGWQEGQPWAVSLAEALAPHGLVATELGNIVLIQKGDVPANIGNQLSEARMPQLAVPQAPAANSILSGVSGAPAAEMMTPQTQAAVLEPAAATAQTGAEVYETWHGPRGMMLSELLENWSHRADVELEWNADYDYPLNASIAVEGGYTEAVRTVLDGFERANPRPVGRLHRNPSNGHSVLVIETRGNKYGD